MTSDYTIKAYIPVDVSYGDLIDCRWSGYFDVPDRGGTVEDGQQKNRIIGIFVSHSILRDDGNAEADDARYGVDIFSGDAIVRVFFDKHDKEMNVLVLS